MNEKTDTPKRHPRVIRAGHGAHFENPRVKPARPAPRIEPPAPPPDAHTLQATPAGKKHGGPRNA